MNNETIEKIKNAFELGNLLNTIAKTEQQIKAKNLSKMESEKLHRQLDLNPLEYAKFQQIKSELYAMQFLSLETANFIYNRLKDYSKTSLAERIVLTQLFALLLKVKMSLVS